MSFTIPSKKINFKILCSDIDGTLLSTKSDVSNFTVEQIQRIKHLIKIVLVSARMPQGIIYLQERLDIGKEPIICYNGALIMEGKKEFFSRTMPLESVEGIYRATKNNNIKLGLYYKEEWYVETDSERVQKEIKYTRTVPVFRRTATTLSDWEKRNVSAHKIMLMGSGEAVDNIFPVLINEFGTQLHVYRSNDTLIEMSPKSVSKLSAIQLLLQPDRSLNEVIAFGDNYNDMEMIQSVGYGVAMGNARKEVKAIAQETALK